MITTLYFLLDLTSYRTWSRSPTQQLLLRNWFILTPRRSILPSNIICDGNFHSDLFQHTIKKTINCINDCYFIVSLWYLPVDPLRLPQLSKINIPSLLHLQCHWKWFLNTWQRILSIPGKLPDYMPSPLLSCISKPHQKLTPYHLSASWGFPVLSLVIWNNEM